MGNAPTDPVVEKKSSPKVNKAAINAFYTAEGCGHSHDEGPVALDLSKWVKMIVRIAKLLHAGTLKPEDLDQELLDKTFTELNQGAKDGWGKDWDKLKKTATPL